MPTCAQYNVDSDFPYVCSSYCLLGARRNASWLPRRPGSSGRNLKPPVMTSRLATHRADRKAACFPARCTDEGPVQRLHVQGALCIDAFLDEDPPCGAASANGPTDAHNCCKLQRCYEHLASAVLGRTGYGNCNGVSGVIFQGSREVIEWTRELI